MGSVKPSTAAGTSLHEPKDAVILPVRATEPLLENLQALAAIADQPVQTLPAADQAKIIDHLKKA
jgi:hypothetical protein